MIGIDEKRPFRAVNIAVLTVSDSRGPAEDRSGQVLVDRIEGAGHRVADRRIVPDERAGDRRRAQGLDRRSRRSTR